MILVQWTGWEKGADKQYKYNRTINNTNAKGKRNVVQTKKYKCKGCDSGWEKAGDKQFKHLCNNTKEMGSGALIVNKFQI